MPRFPRTRTALAGLVLASIALGACSDDDDDSSDDTVEAAEETTTTTAADTTTSAPDDSTRPADGEEPASVDIAATDYAFGGVPDPVAPGTELRIVNQSETELHEVVAVRLPDDETRSAEEILQGDVGALFGSAEPALVALANPGSDEQIVPVGDGTLTEPGRYLLLCSIPQGADPEEYLTAAQTSDGPPQVEGGPPHFTLGMFDDVVVE